MVNSKYVPEFWGLDLETSGTNYTKHGTIQVGLVAPNGEIFDSLVGGWQWIGDLDSDPLGVPVAWEETAAAVHGISKETLTGAPGRERVDERLVEFIKANSETTRVMNRIPVGWNVAGFDMNFFRKDFPKAGKMLSYRSADLNSIIFGMLQQNKMADYNKIKDKVKKQAAEEMGETKWHDAAFDAQAGLIALKYLAGMMGKNLP